VWVKRATPRCRNGQDPQAGAGFDGLEASITQATVAGLREGSGCYDPPAALRERIAGREQARTSLDAADPPSSLLADERHAASERLRVCEAVVSKALAGVLGIAADGFARDIRTHEAEIERLHKLLLGYDRFAAAAGAQLPETARDVLFTQLHGRVGSAAELDVWNDAADALHTDPQAEIEIADPPAPPPPTGLAPASPRVPVVAAAFERMERARAEAEARAAAEQAPPESEAA
jgi:hypothetical protein